jgi:hypothetical protein
MPGWRTVSLDGVWQLENADYRSDPDANPLCRDHVKVNHRSS